MADVKRLLELMHDRYANRSCVGWAQTSAVRGVIATLKSLLETDEKDDVAIESFKLLARISYNLAKQLEQRDREVTHYLEGNEAQLQSICNILRTYGIRVVEVAGFKCGLYSQEDLELALYLIWDSKPMGWWCYEDLCIKHQICTKEQWDIARKNWQPDSSTE